MAKTLRHEWHFKVYDEETGEYTKASHWSRVRNARHAVTLTLTESHIQRSLDIDGQGDSQKCAGTICVKAHRREFPHDVVGYTDWADRVVWIATRLENGWPGETIRYTHYDRTAINFDTSAGCRRLIQRIRTNGGSITIRLYPYRPRKQTQAQRPTGRSTGTRGRTSSGLHAAELRAARTDRGLATL